MSKCKTDEQFKQEVFNLVGDEYEVLEPYTNNQTEIRVKHNGCGHVYKVRPDNFLSGQRCQCCSGIKGLYEMGSFMPHEHMIFKY